MKRIAFLLVAVATVAGVSCRCPEHLGPPHLDAPMMRPSRSS